jgi:Flp pilus assembly protein TadB
MTDLVTDPNFIAMLAGVIVIYGAMVSKWRSTRNADKAREKRRKAEIKDALDALRAQVDAGLIEFDDYEAEVRELMGAD